MLISKLKKENEEVSTGELETLVGLKLPEQYLIFLRKYNGGNTPNTNWTGKCKSDVRYFYGLNVGDKNRDIAQNLTYASVQDLIKQIPDCGELFRGRLLPGLLRRKRMVRCA